MNELIKYLNNLYETIRKDWRFFNESQTSKIVNAIENKENIEEIDINNPQDIVDPIVEAQNATTDAVKGINIPEPIPVDFSSLEGKIEAVKEAIQNKDMTVNVGKTIVDTQGVIKAIQKMEKNMPKMEKQEVIDYTLMFDEMMGILEKPKDHSEIIKLQKLVEKLGTSNDLIAIAEWLKVIALKEYPEQQKLPVKDGRILVSVDKVGGGGGGLTQIETKSLVDLESKVATEDTLQKLVGFDVNSNSSASIATVGSVITITETDGIKTLTTTIDITDPNNKSITSVWS